MERKKKVCAGFDGVPHEDYIYKNINGKKYCKSCTYRLQPPKSIPKVTEKQKFKITLKKDLHEQDRLFYLEVWEKRFRKIKPYCEVCEVQLPSEPNLMNFHHICEKRNYPSLRHFEPNIAILCPDCHNRYETYPDNVPSLVERRKELLEILDILKDVKTKLNE